MSGFWFSLPQGQHVGSPGSCSSILHKGQILYFMFWSSVFDISQKECVVVASLPLLYSTLNGDSFLYFSFPEIKQHLPCENLTELHFLRETKWWESNESYSEESCNLSMAACVCEKRVWLVMRMSLQLPLESFVCVTFGRLPGWFCLDISVIYSSSFRSGPVVSNVLCNGLLRIPKAHSATEHQILQCRILQTCRWTIWSTQGI